MLKAQNRKDKIMAKKKVAKKKTVAKQVRLFPTERVEVADIKRSPYQARKVFDKLEELGQSMESHGLLEPIVVRRKGEQFELIAGERRLRAAKAIKWTSVPAIVRDCDDQKARELCVIENLQRADLNPIEKANALKTILKGDKKLTQAQLGERVGLSQGGVANLLRLLELPEPWKGRCMSGEITQAEARSILPWVKYPAVMDSLVEHYAMNYVEPGKPAGLLSEGNFRDWLNWAIDDGTRPIVGKQWECGLGRYVEYFQPTDEQRAELGIIEHDGEDLATNVELWDELHKAHVGELLEEKGKPKAKCKTKAAAKAGEKPKPPTAAEKKAAAAEEKRKKAERAKQFKRRVEELRINWLRYLIAEEIGCYEAEDEAERRLAVTLHVQSRRDDYRRDKGDSLDAAMGSMRRGGGSPWKALAKLPADELHALHVKFLQDCFWHGDEHGPNDLVPAEDVEAVAAWYAIDLDARWKDEQCGPLSEAFWNLFDKEQLAAGVKRDGQTPAGTKKLLVEQLLDADIELPAELAGKKARKK